MNFAKLFTTLTLLGFVGISVVSARENERLKQEVRAMKNTLKRMKKQIFEMRESIDLVNKGDAGGFTTAFKMRTDEEDSPEESDVAFEEKSEFYTVREYNGMIGIFDDGDELVQMIDRSITSFDAPDRQSLLLGVRAESDSELEKIVGSFK